MTNKESGFFQKRSVAASFGVIALIGGFIFLNLGTLNPFTGKVTGNIILSGFYPFSLISVIGLLLIICAAILIIYAIVKKE